MGIIDQNSSHGQVKELVPAQPVAQGAPQWYQEAQDLKIPVSQGHRPQVPPQPQACSSRQRQGSEGAEGRQARDGIRVRRLTVIVDYMGGRHAMLRGLRMIRTDDSAAR